MLDVTSISAIVAAAGVLVGVFYYILDMRHQKQERKKDLVIELASKFVGKEFLEAFVNVYDAEFRDYDEFARKYGKLFSKSEVSISFMIMGNFFEQIGVLLRNRLIDSSLIDQLVPVVMVWEKMKPFVEEARKVYDEPKLWEWFEYLYDEIKKREQKLQKSKA